MIKHLCTVIFIALALRVSATDFTLNGGVSRVHLIRPDTQTIVLELDLAAISVSDQGSVILPPEFDPYLSNKRSPVLEFHLALPDTGDYDYQISEHHVATSIRALAGTSCSVELATFSKPYWLRDIRGVDVTLAPIRESAGELVVSDRITVTIQTSEGSSFDAMRSRKLNPYFIDIYKRHFINFANRYEDLAEYGSMAVICPTQTCDAQIQQFRSLIQPWVDWKNQKGIPTTVFSTNLAGSSYEQIRNFIQDIYDNDPNLTFVQLVGDYAQVPCQVTTILGNTGGMDAFYSLLEGDDAYPDIFVGRFSAETASELYTQVKRSLDYEKTLISGAWLNRAAGVCSNNPPIPGDDDEHNWEHLDNIRAQLLDYGYAQVDRIYANEGATLQDLISSLNEGKSLVNYCGEGYPTHWVNPPFSVTDAFNLANSGMLPFIHVVSCWTGQFYDGTCLAEALMRSRDPTAEEARGAIAVYAAAPEQGVAPPMEAQDHAMELLVNGAKNTIGGLCYNGSASMIDAYGDGGAYNFLAWNLFGDASLLLRTKPAEEIAALLPNDLPAYHATLDIDAGAPDVQVCLSQNNLPVASGFSGTDGIAHLQLSGLSTPGEQYLLTLSGFNLQPVQRNLTCYDHNNGDHAILDLTKVQSDQFIEPETEIVLTVRITNRGQVPAEGVIVNLLDSQDIYPMIAQQQLGQILPGEVKSASLSYKINRGIPDLTAIEYSIAVLPTGGIYSFLEVVHAPTISIEGLRRFPQPNWINPGDSFEHTYLLCNTGSAVLKDLQGCLTTNSGYLQVVQPHSGNLTLNPGCADSLSFAAIVSPGCPANSVIGTTLSMEATNAMAQISQQWIVSEPGLTVESFETRDLQTFPWIYQSSQWAVADHTLDGSSSLGSLSASADSVWLQLNFIALQPGEFSFSYDLLEVPACGDVWTISINQTAEILTAGQGGYIRKCYSVVEGQNTLRWAGKRDPANEQFTSNIYLDFIRFPARSVFENAQLLPEHSQVEILLAPGEIRQILLSLATVDGKYIQYQAVLQSTPAYDWRDSEPRLQCNKSSCTPGCTELFLLTLYNTSPTHSIRQVSLDLPEETIATYASAFVMPGQVPLAFSGALGSLSRLLWLSGEGSLADSLRAGIRLVIGSTLQQLALPYSILSIDYSGQDLQTDGVIELLSNGSLPECLFISGSEGDVHDGETACLLLTANQNLLQADSKSYELMIYFNGINCLSIPVRVDCDNDPPGFYDNPKLLSYPNPISSSTVFAYSVDEDGPVELAVFNLRGQKVITLLDGELGRGYYRTAWLLADERGGRVANGTYLCRLKTASGKAVVLRCTVIR